MCPTRQKNVSARTWQPAYLRIDWSSLTGLAGARRPAASYRGKNICCTQQTIHWQFFLHYLGFSLQVCMRSLAAGLDCNARQPLPGKHLLHAFSSLNLQHAYSMPRSMEVTVLGPQMK